MNRNLKLVGIGIFSWIVIGMFVYLIDRAIKDIFFEFIPVKAVIIFAVTKSLNVILYVLGVKYLISKINATKFDESKLLKKSFISIFVLSAIQIILPVITIPKSSNHYNANRDGFYYFDNSTPIVFISLVIELVIYGIVFYLITKSQILTESNE